MSEILSLLVGSNPSLLEILWTFVTLVGALESANNWGDARRDARNLERDGLSFIEQGLLTEEQLKLQQEVAQNNMSREVDRLLVLVLFAIGGALSMLTQPSARTENQLLSLIVAFAFMTAAIRLTLGSRRDRLFRYRFAGLVNNKAQLAAAQTIAIVEANTEAVQENTAAVEANTEVKSGD